MGIHGLLPPVISQEELLIPSYKPNNIIYIFGISYIYFLYIITISFPPFSLQGMAFTLKKRHAMGIDGLLPPAISQEGLSYQVTNPIISYIIGIYYFLHIFPLYHNHIFPSIPAGHGVHLEGETDYGYPRLASSCHLPGGAFNTKLQTQ